MGWALVDAPEVDQIMVYEARVNYVLARHQQPAVCAYDLTRITAETMMTWSSGSGRSTSWTPRFVTST